MSDLDNYIRERSAQDPEFKASYEAEAALLALVRARQDAKMSQGDVAKALNVSQPYIAQIERGTRPVSLLLMMRYANAVGAHIHVSSDKREP